ncbi:MAG: hypothetical protein HYV60_23720, partial [Planctomycetia bacterium]|nr:hypothetical protein [Planctomycetia bacterium]
PLATAIAEQLSHVALAGLSGAEPATTPARVYLDKFPISNGPSHNTIPTRVFHETDALPNENEKLSKPTARSNVFTRSDEGDFGA